MEASTTDCPPWAKIVDAPPGLGDSIGKSEDGEFALIPMPGGKAMSIPMAALDVFAEARAAGQPLPSGPDVTERMRSLGYC